MKLVLKQGLADHSLFENLKKFNPVAEIFNSSSLKLEALIDQFDRKSEFGTREDASWMRKFKEIDKNYTPKAVDGSDVELIAENQHSKAIQTFTLQTKNLISIRELENFVDVLGSSVGSEILRIKGVIGVIERPNLPVIVQGVQYFMHPIEQLECWPCENRISFLVIIATGRIEKSVRRSFNAFFGIPTIDSPDKTAITENPLAIKGFSLS